MSKSTVPQCQAVHHILSGFHLALVVFAAIQIHETRAALVSTTSNSWIVSLLHLFVRCYNANLSKTGSGPGSLWRKVLPYLIVTPVIIAASWISLLFWVRELYFEFGWVLYLLIFECGLTHQDRWAIFHVVGANPAMKSTLQCMKSP